MGHYRSEMDFDDEDAARAEAERQTEFKEHIEKMTYAGLLPDLIVALV